jgi:RimJ/RimL family protein N-acetyltransferase
MRRGETVSLFPFERRHLDVTREWSNNPELMRLLDRGQGVSVAEHERWFTSLAGRTDCIYFAIELNADDRHIGNIWLWQIDHRHRRAELRIVIGDTSQYGRGAGSEAISLLCEHAFTQLKLHRIYAYVLAINPRARRAFENAGFALEGTLRQDRLSGESYTDVYLLGRLE